MQKQVTFKQGGGVVIVFVFSDNTHCILFFLFFSLQLNKRNKNTMQITICKINSRIYASHSLKEKRRVISSIKDKVSSKYKVSIAEVGSLDSPQLTEIGISIVSNRSKHSESVIDKVLEYIEGNFPSIEVIEIDRETIGGF